MDTPPPSGKAAAAFTGVDNTIAGTRDNVLAVVITPGIRTVPPRGSSGLLDVNFEFSDTHDSNFISPSGTLSDATPLGPYTVASHTIVFVVRSPEGFLFTGVANARGVLKWAMPYVSVETQFNFAQITEMSFRYVANVCNTTCDAPADMRLLITVAVKMTPSTASGLSTRATQTHLFSYVHVKQTSTKLSTASQYKDRVVPVFLSQRRFAADHDSTTPEFSYETKGHPIFPVFVVAPLAHAIIGPIISGVPQTKFSPETASATMMPPPSTGVIEPRYRIDMPKGVAPPKFYGIDHPSTPKDFLWSSYESALRSYIAPGVAVMAPSQLYTTIRGYLSNGYAELDVTEYEKSMGGESSRPTWTYDGLIKFVERRNHRSNQKTESTAAIKKLRMTKCTNYDLGTFRSLFSRHRRRGEIEDDRTLREHFFNGLHPEIQKKVLDVSATPPDPTAANVFHTGTATPYTLEDLEKEAEAQTNRYVLNQTLVRARTPVFPADEPRGKFQRTGKGGKGSYHATKGSKGKSSKGGKGGSKGAKGSTNSNFTAEERQKMGVGRNGVFARDGTPRTCNICNDPDHMSYDCPKAQSASYRTMWSQAVEPSRWPTADWDDPDYYDAQGGYYNEDGAYVDADYARYLADGGVDLNEHDAAVDEKSDDKADNTPTEKPSVHVATASKDDDCIDTVTAFLRDSARKSRS